MNTDKVNRGAMEEYWKPLRQNAAYYVSTGGRVWSVQSRRFLALNRSGNYLTIRIRVAGVNQTCLVHRLVAEAFCTTRPGAGHVNHIDADTHNNSALNLEWVSPKENVRHTLKLGRYNPVKGEAHAFARLTEEQVNQIRSAAAKGRRLKDLATKYGVAPSAISVICARKAWRHI